MSERFPNDVDPIETRDWLQAIESVIREEGVERAQSIITFVPPMIFLAIVFTGCGEDVKTVEYYQEHTAERDAKISECLNNPGQAKDDPNCANAGSAKLHSGIAIEPGKAPDGRRYENFQ